MEAAALSVGKSMLKGVVSYAKSAIAQEVALQLGIQRDQAFIRDELEMMLAFLIAAHEERDEHKVIETWVKQVRDTAYDVEDTLLDFAVRLKKPSWWRILGMLKMLIERHRVAKQMKELRAKVEDVSQRNARYRLIKGSKTTATLQPSDAGFNMEEEARKQPDKYGEVDLSVLISREDKKNLQVISLWGTTGVRDQTSLMKWAYDDLKKDGKFDCYGWIRIMHPFNATEFLMCVIRQFYINDLEKEGMTLDKATLGAQVLKKMKMKQDDLLLDEFSGYVHEKKYLIVLCDISTIEEWDWIMTYFPENNQKGSTILVSTEHIEVARLCAGRQSERLELKGSHLDQRIYAFCDMGLRGSKDTGTAGSSSNSSTDGETLKAKESSCHKSELIGVENKVKEIIRIISVVREEGPQVISIWGTGGVGKTVLVRNIYQNQKLFEKRAFVTIKHPFVKEDLVNSLTMQLMEENLEKKKEFPREPFAGGMVYVKVIKEDQKPELNDLLREKKYLIVLDDLSSEAEWDAVKTNFTGAAGRIIVTTRDKKIAEYCSPAKENRVSLTYLPQEEAHALFTTKVFNKEITDLNKEYPDLAEEAKSILKWCGGLPLAIVTISSYLAGKPTTRMVWRQLTSHIRAELDTSRHLGAIKNVLNSCYDGLPYYLKSCFLYLSIFPEDYTISRRRLVRRWIAEGYSSEVHGKSIEEIANRYFGELVEKGMIKPSNNSARSRKEIDSCQVHDLMREISILRSMEENLVSRLEEGGLNTRGRTRHLSVSSTWKGDRSEFQSVESSSIRSLTVFGEWRPFFITEKMRSLRVLDLEGTSGLVQHHLEDIGKLVVLKYLSLRGCRGIMHLPESFGNLRQLQTLDISGTSIMYLPKTIVKLTELQYLRAWTKRVAEGEGDLNYFYIAETCAACCAPQVMKRLLESSESSSNYLRSDVCTFCCCLMFPSMKRRLTVPGVVVPKGIRRLEALETLGGVNIQRDTAILRDVARLAGLRKLSVTGINKDNCKLFCSALARLSNLESLLVRSDSEQSLKLELSSPPESLQSLKLVCTLDELPGWVKQLKNLEKLKLKSTKLKLNDTIVALGELPKLKILRLLRHSFQGDLELKFSKNSFECLKVLELDTLGNLTSVEFQKEAAQAQSAPDHQTSKVDLQNTATPKLEFLQYRDRQARPLQPTLFSGLESLPSLREFVLPNDDKYKGDFMKAVQEQLDNSIIQKPKPVLNIC